MLDNIFVDEVIKKIHIPELRAKIFTKTEAIVNEISNTLSIPIRLHDFVTDFSWQQTMEYLAEDLIAYSLKDPASLHSPDPILLSYASYESVIHYRLARFFANQPKFRSNGELLHAFSNRGKTISGIDINPFAEIGRRLVIDHGYGVVIGETAEIGDDCYILGGVVLGSRGISSNPSGKRHPTIGNNVEIGNFATILGKIAVGSNSFIGPHCVVTSDIPENSKVTIINQLQISKLGDKLHQSKTHVMGVLPTDNGCIIYGKGFNNPIVKAVDGQFQLIPEFKLEIYQNTSDSIHVKFKFPSVITKNNKVHLSIFNKGVNLTILSPFNQITHISQTSESKSTPIVE